MPDDFDEIVKRLREEPEFLVPARRPRHLRARMVAGAICCVAAIALLIFGGVTGAVLAVIPWLAGMILVVVGRERP
jgi:hypothetical protein